MGITDLSTVDWPGKLAAVIFFQGCNLRCPWCQNVNGIDSRGGKEADSESVVEHLERLKPMIDSVVLTGGEPLLQPEACLELLHGAERMRLSRAIETNATNPKALAHLLPYLDLVAIDVKAPLDDPELYARAIGMEQAGLIDRIKESLKLAVNSEAEVEARVTIVPTLNDDKEIVAKIAEEVKGADRLRLQQFRNQQTLDPSFQALPQPSREKLLELALVAKEKGLERVEIFTIERGPEAV
jgi:pyruvate formate lyase activating enzyme